MDSTRSSGGVPGDGLLSDQGDPGSTLRKPAFATAFVFFAGEISRRQGLPSRNSRSILGKRVLGVAFCAYRRAHGCSYWHIPHGDGCHFFSSLEGIRGAPEPKAPPARTSPERLVVAGNPWPEPLPEMIVCMLTDKPLPAVRPTGIGIAAFSMALALSRRGVAVQYICRGGREETVEINGNLTVKTVRHFSKDNLRVSLSVMKESAPEIVHVHSSAAAPSLVAARALGKVTVFHSHGDQPLHPIGPTLIRNMEMGLSQRVIAVSESTRRDLIRNHGVSKEKVVVAYNGVDTQEFRPIPSPPSMLQRFGLEGFEKIILSVGAVQARKGQLTMVECMPAILKAWPHCAYVNIGSAYEVAFEEGVLRRARELGVSGAVRLLSGVSREELATLVNAADLCVHPSTREPFGLAVVEEMACAKLVVAFDIGAMPEIIEDEVDGILVAPKGREELAKRILGILDDPGLMTRIGNAAREKVEAKFTWDKTAARLEEIYRELHLQRIEGRPMLAVSSSR